MTEQIQARNVGRRVLMEDGIRRKDGVVRLEVRSNWTFASSRHLDGFFVESNTSI